MVATKSLQHRIDQIGFIDDPVDLTLDLYDEIETLKKKKNAILLAHYYQEPAIQDVADFIGDSLGLSRHAAVTSADIIVFAGVHFMAETAKILSPEKKVILPDLNAGCSLADTCPSDEFSDFCDQHPDHLVMSYINCSAGVKARSDIICTSTNAEHLLRMIPESQQVIFAPDRNLGRWLELKTKRKLTIWDGVCIVHETFSERKLLTLKVEYPDAKVLAHPECEEAVLRHANYIGSTSGIRRYAKEDDSNSFIIATEEGILHQMRKDSPHKHFIAAPPESGCNCNQCPHMRLNTLEKLYTCMYHELPEIRMEESIRKRALKPIERMIEMSEGVS